MIGTYPNGLGPGGDRLMITPTWQETLVALYRATTPQDLWLVLLAHHGISSSSASDEPYSQFTNFHADEPADTVTTALLL